MDILWGHKKIGLYLEVISTHLRPRYIMEDIFGVAKISNLLFGVLEIPDIIFG